MASVDESWWLGYASNMLTLSSDDFMALLRNCRIKARLIKELRLLPLDWAQTELAAIRTKDPTRGVLLLEQAGQLRAVPFELSVRISDPATGRTRPIVCDFCYTWQAGGNAARITVPAGERRSVTYLCCADIACSQHVRNLTAASRLSRVNLREDLTTHQRVQRLRGRLTTLLAAETVELV